MPDDDPYENVQGHSSGFQHICLPVLVWGASVDVLQLLMLDRWSGTIPHNDPILHSGARKKAVEWKNPVSPSVCQLIANDIPVAWHQDRQQFFGSQ